MFIAWLEKAKKKVANSAQALLLPWSLPRCVLRLGLSILILKATSDLGGGTCKDKPETLALGLSPILLLRPYAPLWMLPKEISLGLSFSICKMGLGVLPCMLGLCLRQGLLSSAMSKAARLWQ